ncbi:unnamed protein product [Lampetra fluviatilis]
MPCPLCLARNAAGAPRLALLGPESDVNYCDQHRCRHRAECINKASNYTCVCPIGFRGDLCQEEMKVFESKTKIEEEFDSDLENESSEKFKTMRNKLETSMNSHLKVELKSEKVKVVVISFKRGSIVVDSIIAVDNLVNITMQTVENGLRNILLAVANDTKLPMNVSSVVMSDFDECQNSTRNDCSPFGTCTNTEGSFNCACLPFYEDVSVDSVGRDCLAPRPPRNVSVSLQTTTELELSWLSPSSSVDGFNCTLALAGSGNPVVAWKSLPASELRVNFSGLLPGATYSFTVHSYRGNLTGDAVQLNATTKPLTAVNVHASKTFSSITVTWDAPSGNFDWFTLSVAPTDNNSSMAEWRVFNISDGTGFKQRVVGLVWGMSYSVALFTVSNGVKSSAAFPTNSNNGVLSTDFNRYEATLRIGRVFDKNLESSTSKEFVALAAELKTELDREMSKRLDSYVGVTVKRFWNGSVNADLNILLSPGNVSSWSEVADALDNSTKNFINITILNVSITDVDECADKNSYCDPNADCFNMNGTFSCTCRPPFINLMNTSAGLNCSDQCLGYCFNGGGCEVNNNALKCRGGAWRGGACVRFIFQRRFVNPWLLLALPRRMAGVEEEARYPLGVPALRSLPAVAALSPAVACTSGYSGAKCETEDGYLGKVVGIPVGLSLAAIVLGVLGYLLFTKTRFARKKFNITDPKQRRHVASEAASSLAVALNPRRCSRMPAWVIAG